jgi:hypothetical protein
MNEITAQEIEQHYSATMDSVNLINKLKAKDVLTEKEADTVARNQEHLVIMLGKEYWTTEDLAPFSDAIAS